MSQITNGLRPRFGPPDRIYYLLLAGPPENLSILIPKSLSHGYLELMQTMPKATHQFLRPFEWHRRCQLIKCFRHYDFSLAYDDAAAELIAQAIQGKPFTVIFLHSRSATFWQMIRDHRDKCLVLTTDLAIATDVLADPILRECHCADFPELFHKLTERLAQLLGEPIAELEESMRQESAEWKEKLKLPDYGMRVDCNACGPNEHTFLQLIAPYAPDLLTLKAIPHSQRPAALIRSADRILRSYDIVAERGSDTLPQWPIDQPPLVLTWPYFGPNHKASFKSVIKSQTGEKRDALKIMAEAAFSEQDPRDYEYHLDIRLLKKPDMVRLALQAFQVELTTYLDSVAYLHASFQDSPVLRMPFTAKSVNEPLASFQDSCVGRSTSDRKASQRMRRCGKNLGDRFPEGFLTHIEENYDQMVAITDIPIEWTLCNGVPLGFLVDICRLPQSDPSSVLTQYASNISEGYSVKSNILEKTLIICGVPSTDLIGKISDSYATKLRSQKGPKPTWVRCLTKADFIAAVDRYRPDLLIVDSHGNYETNEEGSYLSVGDEKILGDDILKINHPIPLVILSCCITAPLYGCSNTIAQAFFEQGSRSVLSTFLPISIKRGYMLWQRILTNLESSLLLKVHHNWLSFVSYTLRTSHFDDYYLPLIDRVGPLHDYDPRRMWMQESLFSGSRRQAYLETPETVVACYKPEQRDRVRSLLQAEHIIPEAFYYTLLGRADLVRFDSWVESQVAHDPKAKEVYDDTVALCCL